MKNLIWFISVLFYSHVGIAQVELDKPINGCKTLYTKLPVYILTSPNQLEKCTKLQCDSIRYDVVLSDSNTVNYISTADRKFKTPDGLAVGVKYGDIESKLITYEIYDLPEWAKVCKANDGWYIAFDYKTPLRRTSKVLYFFKKHSLGLYRLINSKPK